MFSFGSQTRVTSNKHVINCRLKSYTLREPTGRLLPSCYKTKYCPCRWIWLHIRNSEVKLASLNYEPSKRKREYERKIQNSWFKIWFRPVPFCVLAVHVTFKARVHNRFFETASILERAQNKFVKLDFLRSWRSWRLFIVDWKPTRTFDLSHSAGIV